MSVLPPEFIANYPTGRVITMGNNLRQTALDASRYIPPVNAENSVPVGAIIMPVSRKIKDVKRFILANMSLAERHDIYLVVLCSHEAKRQDVAHLTQQFTGLKWLAVDGPFDIESATLPEPSSELDRPSSWDLAFKRNFGLQLARLMGWPSIMFVDDDVEIQDDHLFKQIDIMQSGAKVVASNARHEADQSVVVGAFLETYGPTVVDSYMSSQAILIDMREDVLGFYPQVYCEDWFFLMPYLLMDGHAAWAGSIPQRAYNRFTTRRAKHEEEGDLLAEGMLRLVEKVTSDNPDATFHQRLKELIKLADKSYWEQQILHRAMVIQGLISDTNRRFPSRKSAHIKTALRASLATLIGDEDHDGVRPQAAVEWVQKWSEDVLLWQKRLRTLTPVPLGDINEALRRLGVSDRADFDEIRAVAVLDPHRVYSKEGVRRALAGLPPIARTDKQLGGLESTWILARYLQYHNLTMADVPALAQQLRYDRPVRSLSYNKPAGTVVMIVRAHEPVEVIIKAVQEIVKLNKKNAPIHLIIWVDHSHNGDARSYRDFLLARIMLETIGTNIRLLSAIGSTSNEQESEVIRVVALSYWRTNINSVNHPMVVVNSHNELLMAGTLADLMNDDKTHTISMKKFMTSLAPALTWRSVHKPEDLHAAEQLRRRLLRQTLPAHLSRRRVASATRRLKKAIALAHTSWFEIDDMQYTAIVHNSEGVDFILKAQSVMIVPITYGSEFRQVRSQIEKGLKNAMRMRNKVGRTVEVLLAITGEESQDDLEAYRQKISDNLLVHLEWPVGTFMTSVIVFGVSGADDTLRKIEALACYIHWLENQSFIPRFLWVGPHLNRRVMYLYDRLLGSLKLF